MQEVGTGHSLKCFKHVNKDNRDINLEHLKARRIQLILRTVNQCSAGCHLGNSIVVQKLRSGEKNNATQKHLSSLFSHHTCDSPESLCRSTSNSMKIASLYAIFISVPPLQNTTVHIKASVATPPPPQPWLIR